MKGSEDSKAQSLGPVFGKIISCLVRGGGGRDPVSKEGGKEVSQRRKHLCSGQFLLPGSSVGRQMHRVICLCVCVCVCVCSGDGVEERREGIVENEPGKESGSDTV